MRRKKFVPLHFVLILLFVFYPALVLLILLNFPNEFQLILKITLGLILIIPLTFLSYRLIKNKYYSSRQKNLMLYARKLKANFKPNYTNPLKDYSFYLPISHKEDLIFKNVLELIDKENGDVYIGELEWSPSEKDEKDVKKDETKFYTTMCVLNDEDFTLPNFELTPETIAKKAEEALKMNESEDIDFDDDKKFSNAWWLCSNENILARYLFTPNIRKHFMDYLDRNYTICGQKSNIIIVTNHTIETEKYSNLIKDIRNIRLFLRNNNKFYKQKQETSE